MTLKKVSSVELSFFSYATEDPVKVLSAVNNLIPPELRDKVEFKRLLLRGHFGNPILSYSGSLKKEDAYHLLKHVLGLLPETEVKHLLSNLNLHTDGGSLYIRLGKQDAFLGRFRLCTSDPIRLRVKFNVRKIDELEKVLGDVVKGIE